MATKPKVSLTMEEFNKIVGDFLKNEGVKLQKELSPEKYAELQKKIATEVWKKERRLRAEDAKRVERQVKKIPEIIDKQNSAKFKAQLISQQKTSEKVVNATNAVRKNTGLLQKIQGGLSKIPGFDRLMQAIGNIGSNLAKLPFFRGIAGAVSGLPAFIRPLMPLLRFVGRAVPILNIILNIKLIFDLMTMIGNSAKAFAETTGIWKAVSSTQHGLPKIMQGIRDNTNNFTSFVKNKFDPAFKVINANASVTKQVLDTARSIKSDTTKASASFASIAGQIGRLPNSFASALKTSNQEVVKQILEVGKKIQPVDYSRISRDVATQVKANTPKVTIDYNAIGAQVRTNLSPVQQALQSLPNQVATQTANNVKGLITPLNSSINATNAGINAVNANINSLRAQLQQIQSTLNTLNSKIPNGVATKADLQGIQPNVDLSQVINGINNVNNRVNNVSSQVAGLGASLTNQLNGFNNAITGTVINTAQNVINQVNTHTTSNVTNINASVNLDPVLQGIEILKNFNGKVDTALGITPLSTGFQMNPENSIFDAVQKFYNSTSSQAGQVTGLLQVLPALLSPLFARQGLHHFPMSVPSKIGSPATTTLFNATEFAQWRFNQIDTRLGLPTPTAYKKADGTTETRQHESINDAIEHVAAQSQYNASDLETIEQIVMRTAAEVIKLENILLKTHYDVDALIDWTGAGYNERKYSHPVNMTIGANNLQDFLKQSNLHINVRKFDSKLDAQQMLQMIHYEAGKSAISNFNRVDDANNIKLPSKTNAVDKADDQRWKRFAYEINRENGGLSGTLRIQPELKEFDNGIVKEIQLPTDITKPLT